MNERKKKRKVGKECNLIHNNTLVCLFVVVLVAVADKFLFLFFTTATDILI